jgi:type II secretory pathway pseudopilin PulG
MIKKNSLNKRGQVSAPFEVLVAVVLMGFVIVAGSFALSNLSQNVCIGNKRSDLSNFKEALRDVVLGSDLVIRNINFQTKACFNERHETIQLNTYSDPSRCTAYCGGGTTCMLLEYIYEDLDKSIRMQPIDPICMDLTTSIEFGTDSECLVLDDDTDLWEAIDPSGTSIRPGIYKIFKQGSTSNTGVQKICLLRKRRV